MPDGQVDFRRGSQRQTQVIHAVKRVALPADARQHVGVDPAHGGRAAHHDQVPALAPAVFQPLAVEARLIIPPYL